MSWPAEQASPCIYLLGTAVLGKVYSPAVCTVGVPCADSTAIGTLCATLSTEATCPLLPGPKLDFAPDVDIDGVLLAEVNCTYLAALNIPTEPQRGNLVSLSASHDELLLHEVGKLV